VPVFVDALWALLAATGVRRGEALALRWADVDLEAKRIAIRRSLTPDLRFEEPKSGSARTLGLDERTAMVLREHRRHQAAERLAMGRAYAEHDLLFANHLGEPLHAGSISQQFAVRVRRAGVPKLRMHDLRHTHASLMLAAGVHPKVVSDRLGHSSISITLDLYSHVTPGLDEQAAERAAGLVFGA
jgi:integrase